MRKTLPPLQGYDPLSDMSPSKHSTIIVPATGARYAQRIPHPGTRPFIKNQITKQQQSDLRKISPIMALSMSRPLLKEVHPVICHGPINQATSPPGGVYHRIIHVCTWCNVYGNSISGNQKSYKPIGKFPPFSPSPSACYPPPCWDDLLSEGQLMLYKKRLELALLSE
ncbi:hypothetical protein AVEN_206570-1 [Araneus ventricosus]|uniref:Uncharacterized protein n=1 Tax=Araneus ventricosus TaxID=182803 RepID=A0A4Y2M5Q0_ARAVE|nr:hypothetical protein AVEN_206570-1 [Araneus ventricosus]